MRNLEAWVFALFASIALHVVVLGVMLGLRGCGESTPPPAVQPIPQTDGRATDVASERPSEAPATPEPRAEAAAPKKPDVKKAEGKKPEATKKPAPAKDEKSPAAGWKSYKVKPGDSLTKIARACGCTVHELARANGLSPTANLMVGQTIKIRDVPAEAPEAPNP
ncbi:MAG: LysM peptidoglycan-binding domain-containing protein [Kiritimatiellia bacterium]